MLWGTISTGKEVEDDRSSWDREQQRGYRTIAWALEHPGCYAYGADGDSALAALPIAIRDYSAWIARRESPWLEANSIELRLEDTWTDYNIDETFDRNDKSDYYMVDAWFQHDWKPLTATDIERGLKLLAWSQEDLSENCRRPDRRETRPDLSGRTLGASTAS